MCLAVPGKIVAVPDPGRKSDLFPTGPGRVDFQGSVAEVSLLLVPEAQIGDWVLVHAGCAITTLDETEALATWDYLREAGLDG
ncbi:MAG: HypC/HybG/HupF family hydrogenase formation chaperone [bacterium]